MTRVLLLGDSHGVGLMSPMRAQAPAGSELLAKTGPASEYRTLPPDVTVVAGMGATYFEPRIAGLLAAYQPDVVLVSLGGNEYAASGAWRDRVARATHAVVSAIRGAGAEVAWMDPPPFPFPDRAGVRDMWLLEPVSVFPAGSDLPYSSDHVHLTQAGYRELARRAWAWLTAEGLVAAPPTPSPTSPEEPTRTDDFFSMTSLAVAAASVLAGYLLARALA